MNPNNVFIFVKTQSILVGAVVYCADAANRAQLDKVAEKNLA